MERKTHLAVVSGTSRGLKGSGMKKDSTEQSSDRRVIRECSEISFKVSLLGGGDLDQSRD